MKRTFNYTQRQKIDKQHVLIKILSASQAAGTEIGVRLELRDYNFQVDANVFIQAQRDTAFYRKQLQHPFNFTPKSSYRFRTS